MGEFGKASLAVIGAIAGRADPAEWQVLDRKVNDGAVDDRAARCGPGHKFFRRARIAPEGIAGLRTPILFSRSTLDTARAAPALGAGDWRWG